MPHTQEDAFALALQSIQARGWHAEAFPLATHKVLMAEVVHLGEEVGEFMDALRRNDGDGARVELADCMICLVSVAHLCAFPVEHLGIRRGQAMAPMIVSYGELCRSIRCARDLPERVTGLHQAIQRLADSIWTQAGQPRSNMDLPAVMRRKLIADSERGYRHGGGS